MIRCWEHFRHDDLIHYGICDCQDRCARKAELVDALLDWWDGQSIEEMNWLANDIARDMLNFKEA